jgi:hypothetical protein
MAKHKATLIVRVAQATALISHARPGSEADLQAKARAAIREVAEWMLDKYSDADGCIDSEISVLIAELEREAGDA